MPHDFWTGKQVLVTGATGFFGGWLIRSLLQRGAQITAIVRNDKPESQFYEQGYDQRVRIERGSVYDAAFFTNVIERTRPDVFFHAACGADVARVLEEPVECYRTTVESTWNALETLRTRPGLSHCITVLSSSDKVYGVQDLPYLEDKPLRPMHPYEVAMASGTINPATDSPATRSAVRAEPAGLLPARKSALSGPAPGLTSRAGASRPCYVRAAAPCRAPCPAWCAGPPPRPGGGRSRPTGIRQRASGPSETRPPSASSRP